MADKEHEEWLQDERDRRQARASHRASTHKLYVVDQEQKKSETVTDDVEDSAADAAEERAAQESEDGFQAGLAI